MKKIIAISLLAVLAAACSKKDEKPADNAKPADKAAPGAMKPADNKMAPAPTPAPTAGAPTPAPAAGGAVTIKDDADYEAKAIGAMTAMTAIFAADGADCGKLAKDLDAYITTNTALFTAASGYEKEHPDAKKALDTKSDAMMKDFMAKAGPAMDKCKDDKGLQDVMKKMPE